MSALARALPLLLSLLAAVATPVQARLSPESEPVLPAIELAQPALLSGPGWQSQPQVPVLGFMARFTLDTPHGAIVADSVELLEVRAAEMAAIEVLDQVSAGEAFALAGRESLEDSGEALLAVVGRPVQTLVDLPAGVLRYFQRQADRWGDRYDRHRDRIGQRAGNEGDPYDMVGPMNAGREERAGPRNKRRWWQRAGREGTRLVKDYAKYGAARRTLARELGIDPYAATSNPALNARLDRLAWAAAAGSFGAGQLLGGLPAAGREVLSQAGRLNEVVWELPPEDLRARNRELLSRWCGDEFQLRRLSRHRPFLASVQTRLADAIDRLQPASGCEHVLDLALSAEHEVEARFLANALHMAAEFLGPAAAGARLDTVTAALVLDLADGVKVVPLPVDHLSWTAEARDFFRQPALSAGPRTVLVAGNVSDRALRELTTLGWEIVVRTPFAGAPVYPARCCA